VNVDDAGYALELVRRICRDVGPGVPGSVQERKRAEIITRELAKHLDAENVSVEEFAFAPAACLSAFPLSAILMLLAALANAGIGRFSLVSPWISTIAAVSFCLLSILVLVLEFVFGFEFIDPFFRKAKSVNVIGRLRRPGTAKVARVLIVSGHHDSAPENTWLRFTGYGIVALSVTAVAALLMVLIMSGLQLVGLLTANATTTHLGTIGWRLVAFPIAPAFIFGLFFTHGTKNGGVVPGAVDNLSASAVAVALCKIFVTHPALIPADTELRFISFGGEEAGLRGSRRYVGRHLDDLRQLDARDLNIEMIAHPEITILTSEKSGTVKNSPEMVNSVVGAAERAGVPYRLKGAVIGEANDAGSFSLAGLKATTIIPFKMPQQLVAFYHQKWDTPDVLTVEPLLNVLKVAVEWIRQGGDETLDESTLRSLPHAYTARRRT
jgi:hypothetical protein